MVQWSEHLPLTNVTQVEFCPSAKCGLSLLLIVSLVLGFFSGLSSFPSMKTIIPNFQFDQDREPEWKPAKTDVTVQLQAWHVQLSN